MSETNILKTAFEIEKGSYQADLESLYVKPSEQAAQKSTAAFKQAESARVNAGKESLARLKNLNQETNEALKPTFAESYKRAYDDITKRAESARNAAQKFAQTRIDKGQFDVVTQGAIATERRISSLITHINKLRADSADPKNGEFFKHYVQNIRAAEAELVRLERKQKQIFSGGSGGGGGNNVSVGGGGFFGGSGGSGGGGVGRAAIGQITGAFGSAGQIAGAAAMAGPIAAAAAAIFVAVTAVKELLSVGSDLAQQSVVLAATFEETTNSIAVFAGSTRLAREELRAMDDVALDTNGLRLETAEKGYQRLRALGFEAKLTRDLIQGLGKQRVLSGSTDQDVGRVIVNLTQLRGDAKNATRDLREIIHAIPSTRNAFREAFGTTSTSELKELLEANPDQFFERFAAALANTKEAQAGFNVTLEKGKDSLVEAGRIFGEPLLDPLTDAVKNLTSFVRENKDELKEWGETFGDIIRGLAEIAEWATYIKNLGGGAVGTAAKGAVRTGLAGATYGTSEVIFATIDTTAKLGDYRQKRQDAKKPFDERFPGAAQAYDQATNTVDFSKVGKTPAEVAAELDAADVKRQEAEQRRIEKEEELIKSRAKLIEKRREIALADITQQLDEAKALVAAGSARANPLDTIRQNAALEVRALQEQIEARQKFYKEAIKQQTPEEVKKGDKFVELSTTNALETSKLESAIIIAKTNARKAETDEIKRQAQELKKLRDETKDFLVNASEAARDNNPFLKIFAEAESLVERFEQRFKNFGGAFAREMAKIELQKLVGDVGQARYAANSQALRFDQERRNLENLQERKTADFTQALERVQAQVTRLTQNAELAREIKSLSGLTVDSEISQVAGRRDDARFQEQFRDFQRELAKQTRDKSPAGRRQFAQTSRNFQEFQEDRRFSRRADQEKIDEALEQLAALRNISVEGTGIYGQEAIAQAVANVINPVKDIRTDSGKATELNAALIAANKTRIAANNQKLADTIDDQRFLQDQRREATERLGFLAGQSGLTRRQTNDEILAITGELGSANLNPALKRARIEALKEGAASKRLQEDKAHETLLAIGEVMTTIDTQLKGKGLKLTLDEVPFINLSVENGLAVQQKNLPKTPSAADTGKGMGLNEYRWVDKRTSNKLN